MVFVKSKKFSFILVGRVISRGLFGAFFLVFAVLLEPEQYGNLGYLISIAGTVAVISRFGLSDSVIVYHAKNPLLANQVNVMSVITISVASIILLTIDIFAAFLCLATSLCIMNMHNLIGLKDYKKFFWLQISKGILIIILPISLYFFFELQGILIGMSIAYILHSFNFIKRIKFVIPSQLIKKNFKVLINNYGVDLSGRLGKFVDKLLIAPLFGFAVLGIYQLNVQVLFTLEMVPIALHSFLLSEESSGKKHKKISLFVLCASVIIVVAIIIFSPFVISTFLPKYIEGIPSLQIIIITLIPLTLSAIFSAKLQSAESTKVGYSIIIRIGSLLGLITLLGNQYGLIGISYAILISSFLYTTFLFYLYRLEKSKIIL